jgi:acyl-CoA oxidase
LVAATIAALSNSNTVTKPAHADQTLLEFAPLIYVAWSDGQLTDDELMRLRSRIARKGAGAAVQRVVEQWLNPEQPPTPAQLYGLLEMIRSAAHGKTRGRWASLVDFGRSLARRSNKHQDIDESTPEILAMREIESALGVVGPEAMRAILGTTNEPSSHNGLGALDTEQLAQFVDGERYDIRRYICSLLLRPAFSKANITTMAEYRERVLEWCQELARLEVSSYGYPRAYGGEANIPKAVATFETLAYHDLSLMVKYGVQFGLFGGSVLQLGTQKHHDAYLRAIAKLEMPGCFAMTETGHGSNVRDIATSASYDVSTGEFVIDTPTRSAWKDYIGNAALHARMATVFAQLEVNGQQCGVHAFLVPLRDRQGRVLPGVQIEDCGQKIGLNGVDNGRIAFTNVRIPLDNLLDRFGSVSVDGTYSSPITSASRRFFTMLGTLVAGRISVAAGACSATKLGLTIATHYAAQRKQFGPEGQPEIAILRYRAIQRRLIPLIARTYALDFAINDTVHLFNNAEENARQLELRAAALKAAASEHAVAALQYARELCGGQGYLWENRIGELRADTDVFTTFEGANNVLWQLVGKGLLTELREQFEEMRMWAAVKHVTSRAGTAVAELNPVITRKTDEEHLRDPEFHAAALKYREARLLRSVATRLRALIADGEDSFEAVNKCQDHLIMLAQAHAERIALESMHARIPNSGSLKELMDALSAVYALSTIESDRGWFLESGYIEAAKSKAIRSLLTKLCGELHELAPSIVDGWGIPARYLPALARPTT